MLYSLGFMGLIFFVIREGLRQRQINKSSVSILREELRYQRSRQKKKKKEKKKKNRAAMSQLSTACTGRLRATPELGAPLMDSASINGDSPL